MLMVFHQPLNFRNLFLILSKAFNAHLEVREKFIRISMLLSWMNFQLCISTLMEP